MTQIYADIQGRLLPQKVDLITTGFTTQELWSSVRAERSHPRNWLATRWQVNRLGATPAGMVKRTPISTSSPHGDPQAETDLGPRVMHGLLRVLQLRQLAPVGTPPIHRARVCRGTLWPAALGPVVFGLAKPPGCPLDSGDG
jgi:hypothetical protein